MKTKWKAIILIGLLIVIAGAVFASIRISKQGVVTVQTGRVARADLTSIVTASGEVKPRNYINIGANTQGAAPITAILVKEGDRVHKGQVLARLANVQQSADLSAQRAALNATLADSAASEAAQTSAADNIAVAESQVEHDKADLEQKRIDLKRSQDLFGAKLISSQDFEAKKAQFDLAQAVVNASEKKVAQAKSQQAQAAAQLQSAQKKVSQSRAMVSRSADVLSQYEAISPLDGVITNLPVRVGETVVPGIQNSAASTLMTIADMSIITAEVHVDETDIVSVKVNQPAEVTIDAIPNRTFKGRVIEIGDTALVRSTGVAAAQSSTSSQEAKDFKVVIALDIAEELTKPGLSCTANIITATRQHTVAVPIQALTLRQRGQLAEQVPGAKPPVTERDPAKEKVMKEELQGVFVVNNDKAAFREVKTGITGSTDIEVLDGLKDGDQIVTGSYQVIRSIRNGAKVKVDNKPLAPTPTAAAG